MPVSYYPNMRNFTNIEININKGDKIYLFSDGYADQFGGKKNQKFMIKRFRKLIYDTSENNMNKQYECINNTFLDWKKSNNQIDDIIILGVEI
jgi:serine phosphatase RsbU (regulator of sigma subunit)